VAVSPRGHAFAYLLEIRASTLGVPRRWFQDGDAITGLKVSSTSACCVDPSVFISGGADIKPS